MIRRVIVLLLLADFQLRLEAEPADATPATNPLPARVIIVQDPGATLALEPVTNRLTAMLEKGVTNLTGKIKPRDAWLSLVTTNDVVGIKVFTTTGPHGGTRPAVAAVVVEALLNAGLRSTNIIVWDKRAVDLREARYFEFEQRYGIRVKASIDAGYDEKNSYESPLLGTLIWTDLEFGKTGKGIGRKSYVSKLVTKDMTKIISITPMLHHNLVGVTGNLYSLAMGSVDNTLRFENNTESLEKAVPEIYALPVLGDRVVLNVVDALYCQYEGQNSTLLQDSAVLNQLRLSRDPVALDVLSLKEIQVQSELAKVPMTQTNQSLFIAASLLEIGTSDTNHIRVEKVP